MQFPYQLTAKGNYSLKNVRLETGFEYENEEVTGTKTDLFSIEIEDGKIKTVKANDPASQAIDAKGYLMLPAFRDMHIHLDKTLYGLPWQALSPKRRTVKDMIAYEQEIIPELLKTSVKRAEQLISLQQHYGTHFARTHFNIDPTSGLKSLEHLEQALENKKDSFKAELVAFPQHGVYYTESAPLMKEAAQLKSVGFIGGLDPLSIDGSIEKVMDFTVQLALDHNKGIDIHLHEVGESGMKTINYLIDKAIENPVLQGKTFVSHAFALAHLSPKETEQIAERLAAGKVGIASSVPFKGTVMPIPTLKKYGVNVLIGNDNVQDYWSTFGSGNMLQKANLIAELYGYATEYALSRALQFATQIILPLDEKGKQQWPKAGDEAAIVLTDASCSAEAVSRMSEIKALMNDGNLFWRN
ncbi:cytosine/adenosine deaminase-related metal-dependent hydrolase [Chryseobacterium bernardetii]|uniref:Cytosine/adenosine deaminase-related metal-dependent hydrolase n=2 Tax=Chryseobacterium TaxID=59732 RepID=A0A543EM91_9FLAO|nr:MULTISPECIES: amidohydrolase [Chryseobacterium]MDR6369091.1 cytosine/adenosine deaminase-related metal-dependent hydrolase [Chryseobacterium vietnamense]MDR6439986.1 cytosine/adenosine deaminase-related metal-dependent hydrolase [Chryseobacterium bernardetii]TQM22698.1 cytosine/adenosine deaminase-related metal-dependent hydrolase [Chryseobacterium aquifrigidense]